MYEINCDKTKYDIYCGSCFWDISIYDKNKNTVLCLNEYGITIIKQKDGYKSQYTKPYTKEEQDIKYICSYIKNDIKYFMKQCLTFRRLQFAHVLKF